MDGRDWLAVAASEHFRLADHMPEEIKAELKSRGFIYRDGWNNTKATALGRKHLDSLMVLSRSPDLKVLRRHKMTIFRWRDILEDLVKADANAE